MTDTRDEGRRGVVADIIAEGLDAEAERCDAARRDSGLVEYQSAGLGLRGAAARLRDGRVSLDLDRLRDALSLPNAGRADPSGEVGEEDERQAIVKIVQAARVESVEACMMGDSSGVQPTGVYADRILARLRRTPEESEPRRWWGHEHGDEHGGIQGTSPYTGLTILNREGEEVFGFCLRDDTAELRALPDGEWYRIDRRTGAVNPMNASEESEREDHVEHAAGLIDELMDRILDGGDALGDTEGTWPATVEVARKILALRSQASQPTDVVRITRQDHDDWTELVRLVMNGYSVEAAEKARSMAERHPSLTDTSEEA